MNNRAPSIRMAAGEGAPSMERDQGRRAQVGASLAQSSAAFHELLATLQEDDLSARRPGSWSVGEAAIHVVGSVEQTPALIRALRRGRDHMNLPLAIAEPAKRFYTWYAAHGATRAVLGRRFDVAHSAVLALVDTIQEDEWGRGGHAYGEGFWTVEYAFRHQLEHVEEHVRQIRGLLGPA